jgi:hypothetical protein
VIKNSIIAHNNGAQGGGTYYSGGGISVKLNSEPVFESCKIYSNTSWGNGGGIASFSPSHLVNCLFLDDFSYGEGGAVYLGSANPITSKLTNCTFDRNTAPFGAIIACNNHVALFRNSILWDKWNSNPASMIYLSSITSLQAADIDYCDVIHGESCIQTSGNAGYGWGEHNITQYPGWESTGYALNWDSSCIESGTPDTTGLGLPETDLDGNPRIVNTRVDMGAFEYQQPVEVQSSKFKVQSGLKIYPNPANGDFFVEISEGAGYGWLQIIDDSGRILSSEYTGPGVWKMGSEGLKKGIFLVLFSRDVISHSEKLIIR